MDVIVTAGGKPQPKEPLYQLTQGGYKAMLPLGGKPMIQWVLDALDACPKVEKVVVVGLPLANDLAFNKTLTSIEDQGDMLSNIRAGAMILHEQNPAAEHALVASSDVPGVTPQMVNWLIEQTELANRDFTYNVIERKVMETTFPNSRRTYTHLKDVQVCGGDINAIRISLAVHENPLWNRIIDARKNPFRQASLLGYDTLLYLLLRQLNLDEAEVLISKRLGICAKALRCPYAELGMDVDKPFQYKIMEDFLLKKP